jgi:hypothetical protein
MKAPVLLDPAVLGEALPLMRKKVIKFCAKMDWKVTSDQDGETPNFDEIKKLLENEVRTMERISVSEHQHCFLTSNRDDPISSISPLYNIPAVTSPKPAIDNAVNPATPNSIPLVLTIPAPNLVISTIPTSSFCRRVPRVSRCIWCHSPDHSRRSECMLFSEALKSGNIQINEIGHVVLSSTGAEFPPAFGRGGMKLLYDAIFPLPALSHRPLP